MKKGNELYQANKEVVKVNISYEPLDEDIEKLSDKKRHKVKKEFLMELFNILDIKRNAKEIINPNLDYVVKFPPELLKKIEEHDMQFLKDKRTGELLPDLYDYTEKGIGGKIRLELKGIPTSQNIINFYNAINNLIEQQRYENLIEEIQQLNVAVKRIERGQDCDRFAKVDAGRKHLLDALNYHGKEEEKKRFVFDALAILREGREIIEKTLMEKMDELIEVPKGKIMRIWTCFIHDEYFNEQTKRYNDIQEYFKYYYMSIQPMAYAYMYLEQPQLIEVLLEDSRKIFEHRNIEKLSSIERLYPNDNFDMMWYKNPKKHEQRILDVYKEKELCFNIKGNEILEVVDNGRKQ